MAAGPLRMGLIADIQYSDREDGADFSGTEKRHFRNALNITRAAVDQWNSVGVDVVVQLGDVIDGCNSQAGTSSAALEQVLAVLQGAKARLGRFDLIGNHELYNIKREALARSGLHCTSPDGLTYYSTLLGDTSCWEAVFLDAYDHALIGYEDDHPGRKHAVSLMQAFNPKVLEAGGDWFAGLPLERHRYVPFNGGLSREQIEWLDITLAIAEAEKRKVLVFTHVPLYVPATKPKTIVWNCEDVLSVLQAHREAVVAVFAGHDHDGGYAVDPAGIHHITMNSPLTADVGGDCSAVLECYDDGWARFVAHGRACSESDSKGKGKHYPELILCKGAVNVAVSDAQ